MDANGFASVSDRQRGVPVDVRLFAVSRLMKEEAMAVFFQENIFQENIFQENIFQENIFEILIRLEGAFCSLHKLYREVLAFGVSKEGQTRS